MAKPCAIPPLAKYETGIRLQNLEPCVTPVEGAAIATSSQMFDHIAAHAMPQAAEYQIPGSMRTWFAVFTAPQNERSVARHLDLRQVESFLPTCESTRIWKNRQRVKITQPLFPTYLFARIQISERSKILRTPGVLRIVGNSQGPIPIPASEIEFLRSDFCRQRIEPYRELVVGEKVRIKSGSMQGVQGILVRKKSSLRFVLTLQLINQHAAVEVAADELEPLLN
jgi:transcription antitermination factor NusG